MMIRWANTSQSTSVADWLESYAACNWNNMDTTSWMPPDDPDPSEILSSAERDSENGRYEQALDKHLWFHQHALRYEPALSGVRLSFALGSWMDLAGRFPPAGKALIATRDRAVSDFIDDPTSFELFHDIASINHYLGEESHTVDLFGHVTRRDFATAKRLYHVAERSLVAVGRFEACLPFLDAPNRMSLAAEYYSVARQYEVAATGSDSRIGRFARSHFIEDIATLVALLVLNGRTGEARQCYDSALSTLDDEDFRLTMDAAMTGHFPDTT